MAKIILKSRYLKTGSKLHSEHLIKYIALREGVQKIDDTWRYKSVSKEQKKLIAELTEEFPDTKNSFEYQQLEKNYGKEGAAIIQDNCQLTIAGGFAPSSETADIISRALGTRTVMTGSVSRSKNDPSQSLQMTERALMSADELKSMKKGSFIVMKTGTHPFISKLKLFFKWGISFPENSYTIADKGARCVHYISRETLIKNITARYPQEKKSRIPAANPPSGGQTMTEPAEATFAQEVNHAAQQEKIAKPIRTG